MDLLNQITIDTSNLHLRRFGDEKTKWLTIVSHLLVT